MDLTTLLEKKKAYQQAIKDEGIALLKAEFQEFFAAHPDVNAVRWTQYTPYFNDGDACVFGRHDFETRAGAKDDFRDEWSHKHDGEKGALKYDWQKQREAIKAISDKLGPDELDDLFLGAFGDHVEVIATREAFSVDEYSHD